MELFGNGFSGGVVPRSWIGPVLFGFLLPFSAGAAEVALAPGLKIESGPGREVILTITNAVPNTVYELHRARQVAPKADWLWESSGAVGQTNFTVRVERGQAAFFKARPASDWDSDGVLNWQDAAPDDPEVGLFEVTISSPSDGSVMR